MTPRRETQAKTEGIYSGLPCGSCVRLGNCGASRHGQYDAAAVTAVPGWNAERPVCSTVLENMAHKSHVWDRAKASVEYGSCLEVEVWPPLFFSPSRFAPSAPARTLIVPNRQALDREQEATEVGER